jgi:hypothetical protein
LHTLAAAVEVRKLEQAEPRHLVAVMAEVAELMEFPALLILAAAAALAVDLHQITLVATAALAS